MARLLMSATMSTKTTIRYQPDIPTTWITSAVATMCRKIWCSDPLAEGHVLLLPCSIGELEYRSITKVRSQGMEHIPKPLDSGISIG